MAGEQSAEITAESVYQDNYMLINSYVDMLSSRGIERGLVGPREADRLWGRHILNAVAVADLIPTGSRVIDVGSGAGLPGIPLAVLRPDLHMTLLEPLLRRSIFLEEVIAELNLPQVQVKRSRATDHRQQYDVVTARALAPLPRLLEWCIHLRSSKGSILALKGQHAADELAGVESMLTANGLHGEVLRAQAHPDSEATWVIRIAQAAES